MQIIFKTNFLPLRSRFDGYPDDKQKKHKNFIDRMFTKSANNRHIRNFLSKKIGVQPFEAFFPPAEKTSRGKESR